MRPFKFSLWKRQGDKEQITLTFPANKGEVTLTYAVTKGGKSYLCCDKGR